MSTLQRFDHDGIEILIDTTTGESFASISGYARMSGRSKSTISDRLSKGVRNDSIKTAEIQTQGGMQGVRIVSEDFIAEWLPKDNPAMSSQLIKLGVRVFMHKLAGYEVTSTAIAEPQTPKTYLEALRALVAAEEAKEQLEAENAMLIEENEQLAEALDELFNYSSILRIAKFNGVPETSYSWRTLKIAARKLGLELKRVPCPRFETRLLYPHDAWRLAYPDALLPETTTLRLNPPID